ncbi:MAG: CPBP family glutamic-type intramembrane protease [Lentisphaerota bacterium]
MTGVYGNPYRSRAAALWRWVEFVALYIGVPLTLRLWASTHALLPVLWVAGAVIWFSLTRKTWPERMRVLYAWDGGRHRIKPVLLRFLGAALTLTLGLALFEPGALFGLPRQKPVLWGLIMLCYPVISVCPQGIIYRVFYEARYAALFGAHPRVSLIAGAAVFSLAHLPFRNPWALVFTFFGGLMFLSTYRATRRVGFSNLEHALYGDFLFTVGWGKYLYHGTQALAESVTG